MEENKACYHFHEIKYKDGFFNESVDATYIIHLENNGRHPEIESQLNRYHPTNRVYIVYNRGYKKCRKNLPEKKPPHDLTDAFLQTFKHAIEHQFENILILEDDFIFTDAVKDTKITTDIQNFLNKNKSNRFVYYLGCLPYIQSIGSQHNRLYLSNGTHACIYSKPLVNHILNEHNQSNIIDWDLLHNTNLWYYPRYIYHKPLCYQLFPPTENSQNWYNPMGMADIIKSVHKMAELDRNVEPGYSYFYSLSKLVYIFVWVLMVFALFIILRQFSISGKGMKRMNK